MPPLFTYSNLAHLLYIATGAQVDKDTVSIQPLVREELIRRNHERERWVLTPKGDAFVDMLLATPLPVERWIDPRTLDTPNANNHSQL